MLLPPILVKDTLLLLILEIPLLYMEVFVHQFQLGGVSQGMNIGSMLVCLPRKHCEGRKVEREGKDKKGGMTWGREERVETRY